MDQAEQLIARFGLAPHPEGGWYRETFRAAQQVAAHGGMRAASTAILFLLRRGEASRWHRVRSDEAWHWHAGSALDLHVCRAADEPVRTARLGPVEEGCEPQAVVAAGWWQAAQPLGPYALVGCTVAPGFDFADFALIDPAGADAEWLRSQADRRLVDP